MIMRRLIKIFAVITAIGAYTMILLGVLVTASGSGQGCGNSWPFCHGQVIPGTITIAGLVEYSHRIMSGADGFLVLILTVWCWIQYRRDFQVKLFSFLSILFVVLQGALGALTVVYEGKWELSWLLAVHFGLSLVAFASVILLVFRLFQVDKKPQERRLLTRANLARLRLPLWGLAVYTYIVTYSGALVEHTGAVVGCGTQLPGCGATYLPSFSSLAGIQVLHRYAASLLWLLVVALLVVVVRRYRENKDLVRGSWLLFTLITLQAITGILNVETAGQMLVSLVHATLITVFFSILCVLGVEVSTPFRQRRGEAGQEQEQEAKVYSSTTL